MRTMLTSNSIKLRALEPYDIDLLFEWENDFELWKVSNTLTPFSRETIKSYLDSIHLDIFQTKQLRLMIDTHDEPQKTVGMIDLFDFDFYNSRAGVGIMVHKNHRQKGYADDALKIISNYSFNFLNLHQLYCSISEKNKPSIKLFKNNGFEVIGVKKDWLFNNDEYEDVFFMQKIKE